MSIYVEVEETSTTVEVSGVAVFSETLADMSDVTITSPSNGESLIYNDGVWINQAGAGSGDMLKSVYDPTTVNGDAFDMDNMAEGTNLILTGSERTAISTNSSKVSFPEAPSDGEQYARKDAGWEIVASAGSTDWGDIGGTLSDQTDLQSALDGKEPSKGADDNYVTDAEKVVIGNTSGANTGDQDISEIQNASKIQDFDVTETNPSDGKILVYRSASTAYVLEDKPTSSGNPAWGEITGTVANQTDLQAELDAKADSLTADENYVTDAEKVVIGNTSGTNTGDQVIPVSGVDFDPVGTDNSNDNAVNTTYDSRVTANDAKVSNATHTGDVTGSTALTIASGVVDAANLSATNSPTDNYIPSYDLSTGNFTWVENGSGGSGISWSTPVDSNITVDTDNTYDIGTSTVCHYNIYADYLHATRLQGKGDTNTYISFTTDEINMYAGGVSFFKLDEGVSQDVIVFNEGSVDMDFRVEGLNDTHAIFMEGSSDKTSFGTAVPVEKVTVEGAIALDEITAPTSTSGYGKVYVKSSDNDIYFMDSTGSETSMTASASGGISNIVEDTTPQLGGELDCQAHSIGFTLQSATGDGTTTIDWGDGNKYKHTFGAQNETFTFTAPAKPGNFILMLVQDSTGSRTVTWPSSVKWAGGTAPTLTTDASAVDIVSFFYDGTDYYGVGSLDFS